METPGIRPADTATLASRFRTVAADTIRGLGDGAADSGGYMGVALDKALITPVEAGFAITSRLAEGSRQGGLVGRLSSMAHRIANIGSFVGAFYGMIAGSMVGATGATISDVANGIADRIDGGETAATQAAAAAAAVQE